MSRLQEVTDKLEELHDAATYFLREKTANDREIASTIPRHNVVTRILEFSKDNRNTGMGCKIEVDEKVFNRMVVGSAYHIKIEAIAE